MISEDQIKLKAYYLWKDGFSENEKKNYFEAKRLLELEKKEEILKKRKLIEVYRNEKIKIHFEKLKKIRYLLNNYLPRDSKNFKKLHRVISQNLISKKIYECS